MISQMGTMAAILYCNKQIVLYSNDLKNIIKLYPWNLMVKRAALYK